MKQGYLIRFSKPLVELLSESGLIAAADMDVLTREGEIRPLVSDGSNRRFFRILFKGRSLCLGVMPATADKDGLAESRSCCLIGRHLGDCGVPVPVIHGWDPASGLVLFEDLGDVKLHELAQGLPIDSLRSWYRQVIDRLVHMQLIGRNGFDPGWCWDAPRYDRQVMIIRESQYFLKSFWQDVLGNAVPHGIEDEFSALASCIDGKLDNVFLHRDFQSRNIMIKDGHVRFIDYQAGRLGPPGYDLASLLIDPYMALDPDFQDELLQYYLDTPAIRDAFPSGLLQEQYPYLALQRNLQIIGAFSFLGYVRHKTFFTGYLVPAVVMLDMRVQEPIFAAFPVLRKMAKTAAECVHTICDSVADDGLKLRR